LELLNTFGFSVNLKIDPLLRRDLRIRAGTRHKLIHNPVRRATGQLEDLLAGNE
jgi:hypothetical protein